MQTTVYSGERNRETAGAVTELGEKSVKSAKNNANIAQSAA
jgi:hypothetical protein